MSLLVTRKSRKAFSLTELALAVALMGVVGVLIIALVLTTLNHSRTGIATAANATQARAALTDIERSIQGAQPLGACLQEVSNVSDPSLQFTDARLKTAPQDCRRVGTWPMGLGYTFPGTGSLNLAYLAPTSTSFCIYSYTADSGPGGQVSRLGPPDQVCVYVEQDTNILRVLRIRPSATATYTDPKWPLLNQSKLYDNASQLRSQLVAGTVQDPDVFTYFNSLGNPIDNIDSVEKSRQVSLIRVKAKFETTGARDPEESAQYFDVFIPLSGAVLSGDL